MIICDTHVLIYEALAPQKLSRKARKIIIDAIKHNELACCDASLWEIALLLKRGRVKIPDSVEPFLDNLIQSMNLVVLPITAAIAARASQFGSKPSDPFDQIIAATTMICGATLLSRDAVLSELPGLSLIW